jgi:hypothetical protein
LGKRLGALALLVTLLAAGALLGSALSQWGVGPPSTPATPQRPPLEGRVRVEVLNGGGESGVARDATAALRDVGYDVVYYGNAETFTEDPSVVLDRVGDVDPARWAADVLGIRDVRSAPDSNRYVDVTVRLGPEWSLPTSDPEGEATPLPWWDPRGWFQRRDSAGPPEQPDR